MTRVIKADLRHPTVRVCDRARDLFFKRFGLDWDDFKLNGIDIEALRAPGQHLDLINKLEKVAMEREENGSR